MSCGYWISPQLPVRNDDVDPAFGLNKTIKEAVAQNLKHLILTCPGEKMMDPTFGVGLRNYLFENFDDIPELEDRIKNQIELYIPQIELDRVIVEKNPNSHNLNVKIYYLVLADSRLEAIQVNFSPDNALNNTVTNSPTIGGY